MLLKPLDCPHCGAPLPEDAIGASVTTCPFCNRTLAVEPGVVFAKSFERAAKLLDDQASAMSNTPSGIVVRVGDVPYAIEGRIARGQSSDVFLARRAHRVTERVVIKVLRALGDAPRMAREAATLRDLQTSTHAGSSLFSRLIPQLVQESQIEDPDRVRRPTLVVRHLSGFSATIAEAHDAYPHGVDPRAAVWMWRRTLEMLGWVHAQGRVHGAVLPSHLLLHARDHGVMLLGWSASVRAGASIDATSKDDEAFHPSDLVASATHDLVMSARCIAFVLGGDARSGRLPSNVPSALADVVRACANGDVASSALELHAIVGTAAKQAFGAPTYVPFTLPVRR